LALLALPTERSRTLGSQPLLFVANLGVRRAHSNVPLRAVLQAYRTGHKGFWSAMCTVIDQLARTPQEGMRTTMLLSDYCIDYTDLISVAVTDSYIAEEARLANERTRLNIAVMESLLNGLCPPMEGGRQLCERARLNEGRPMAVLVARLQNHDDEGSRAVHQRSELAAAIEKALSSRDFGRLIE